MMNPWTLEPLVSSDGNLNLSTYTSASRRGSAKASEVKYLRMFCSRPSRLATHSSTIVNMVLLFLKCTHLELQQEQEEQTISTPATVFNCKLCGKYNNNNNTHLCWVLPGISWSPVWLQPWWDPATAWSEIKRRSWRLETSSALARSTSGLWTEEREDDTAGKCDSTFLWKLIGC